MKFQRFVIMMTLSIFALLFSSCEVFTYLFSYSDLSISSLSATRPADTNLRAFTACSYAIINHGPKELSSKTLRVDYYLSNNTVYGDSDDMKIGDTSFSDVSITSGESYPITLNSTGLANMIRDWTDSLVVSGDYYLFANIVIVDSSPVDNVSSNNYVHTSTDFPFTTTLIADLSLTSLSAVRPDDSSLRTFTSCSFTVNNNGPTALSSRTLHVDYYLSDNIVYGDADDKPIGDNTLSGITISSGGSRRVTLSSTGLANMTRDWTVSLIPSGDYYLFVNVVIADASPVDPVSFNNHIYQESSFQYTTLLKVAKPTFTEMPHTMNFPWIKSIKIECSTPGATIRYTTDGSIPSRSNGSEIESGDTVEILKTTNLRAFAYKSGMLDSDIANGLYTVTNKVETPIFSVSAGTYQTAQSVTISCGTSGATIRYTTNGSDPSTTNGTIIASGSSVSINKTTTLKAIAYKTDWGNSDIYSQNYSIKTRTKFTVTTKYIWATAYGTMSNEGLKYAQELYGYFKLLDTGNSSNYSYAYNIARSSYITINCKNLYDIYYSAPYWYADDLGSDSDCVIYERTATLIVQNTNSIEFISSLHEADSWPFTDEDLGTRTLRWTFNGSTWNRSGSDSDVLGEFGLIGFYHYSNLGTFTRIYIATPTYEFVE